MADGEADAASIDSNVLRILLDRNPALRNEVRLLESWGPYSIQPIVVRTGLDPVLKVSLRGSLLTAQADPLTRMALKAFGLKRFAAVGEEDYDAGRFPQPLLGR